ncbi:sulfotransferase family 2 domain-containing protein [Qipengyuania marisflavi]|uniref:Sulfotransferase family protein n=1 Tax=Qipengyuania marisflavi TaxID=2486356 RepID=A0A5S3PT22_9SPHN|nr:sulfotransferase family 2 domain-containing protein [Qipengyuania marisflavi]TMM46743.1 hypothetical protein FEV51_10955 [Qipengyuania marisflavi]
MSAVDRIKQMKQGLEDRLLPQRFVYHHIAKCGGTSVGRALRKRYLLSQATVTPEETFRAFQAFTGRNDRVDMMVDVFDLREQMLLYHMFHDVRGLSLHVRFSNIAWEHFKDRYKFITILREPVKRFVSHYHWSHGKSGAFGRIEEDFEPFLDTERARLVGATFVENLCGLPKEIPSYSDEAVAAAIANLDKFAVVGDLADLPRFETDIRRELGVKVKIGHENARSRTAVRRNELDDPVIRAKVEALCAPDIAVWNAYLAKRGN